MSTQRRLTAASAAAVLGLFLAGCDDTGTEAPAEDVPENEFQESEMGGDVGEMGEEGADDEAGTGG